MNQLSWPFVSVIVPIYNGESLLPKLLESLSQLDYPPDRLEILLVNNNSTDRTPQILTATPFTILNEPQQGAGSARNAGIQQAKGEFLAFTDADCVVDPMWLQDLVSGFTDPSIGAVAGLIEPYQLDHPIEHYEAMKLKSPNHRRHHTFLPTAVTANVMYRAIVFQHIGLFLDHTYGEETDLNWRMQTQTQFTIHFLETGGLIYHRYRANLNAFCRSIRGKARTLVPLHHRWNLKAPSGRKELFRSFKALSLALPQLGLRILKRGQDLKAKPKQVIVECAWETWLDILVPWIRYRGIREGWQQSSNT